MASNRSFLPALESARGIAALLVMVAHFWWWTIDAPLGSRLLRTATLGVDFFFVLSGFILSRTYLSPEAGAQDWRSYAWNRAARIYPLHLFFLGAFVAAGLFLGRSFPGINWVAELTLTTSVNSEAILNGVSWSLSAEWLCYIAFALLLVAPESLPRKAAALSVIILSGAVVLWLTGGDITSLRSKWGFVRGLFGFFIGCLAWMCQGPIGARRFLIWLAVAVQLAYVAVGYGHESAKLWIVPTFAPLVVYLAEPERQKGWLAWPPVLWVGTVSFSLYMGHVFWGEIAEAAVRRWLAEGSHWLELTKSVAALLGAALTYHLVERPFRDLGRHLSPFRRR